MTAASPRAWPAGFAMMLGAQFCSALADNALLIVAMELLSRNQSPAWWAPLLKFCLVLAYVVLAPLAGPLADAWPKARVMAWANGMKLLGVLLVALGMSPLLGMIWVGAAAAVYAPAKYGLLTEWVKPAQLVRANAWLEVSVVGSVLLGTVLGGALVSPLWSGLIDRLLSAVGLGEMGWANPALLAGSSAVPMQAGMQGLGSAFGLLLLLYAVAAGLNQRLLHRLLQLAPTRQHRVQAAWSPAAMFREFAGGLSAFWQDRQQGRFSLLLTSLLWGLAALLQFAVLHLAQQQLQLPLAQAAYLQAVVAVGVAAGAAWAGRHVRLDQVRRLLPAGIALGLLIAVGAQLRDVAWAVLVLAAVGALGGFLIVPLNASLQHRGGQLLSAGRSVAVQGFCENASVLLALGAYAQLLRWQVGVVQLMQGLGIALALLMLVLTLRQDFVRQQAIG